MVKNEIKSVRTFEMLTVAFGEATKTRTQIQLWYNPFKKGREALVVQVRQQPMTTLKQ